MKKFVLGIISCAILFFCACMYIYDIPLEMNPLKDGEMRVHFLDVGQADCQIIQLPNQQVLMIDAGNNDDADFICDYIDSLNIEKIDYLVGTHPHEDHIGSLDTVIENYYVEKVFMPDAKADTKSYYDVLDAIDYYSAPLIITASETLIYENDDISIRAIAPVYDYDDLNNQSIVIRLTYKDSSFLFTGDAEKESESDIYETVEADVLSVGHHGSSTSTSNRFLNRVDPMFAVISCGEGNDYGHPHWETIDKLTNDDITIYRTDKMGTIVCSTMGEKGDYTWETER